MSILSNCEIKCNCGETFEAEVWKAVNVFDDPDLKDVILSGRFNTVECPHCKKVFYHEHFFMYQDLQNELIALNATYPDAIAWLVVPNTNIDTPVFQGKDNNRYLRTDRDGNSAFWGETFLDYDSKIDFSGYTNLVVYGHNTTTDDHFTPLEKYLDKNFYENNKEIEMATLTGNYKWMIFSVFKTTSDNYNDFYIDTNFLNDQEFNDFIYHFKTRSMYESNVEVTKDDDILTLSTCEYSQNNGRLVIMAKLIRK